MDLKNQTQKRTIKFRGKRIDNGEWVYGAFYPIKDEDVYFIINNCKSIDFDDDDTTFNGYKVHKKSVGEFTELHDKNGKEIYEGDILKTYPIISSDKIAYDSFNVLVKFINSSWIANGVLGKRQAEISEVIGSVNENPELLEK